MSLGLASRASDALALLALLQRYYLQPRSLVPPHAAAQHVSVQAIHIYPIKSCGVFSPQRWQALPSGFLYDRYSWHSVQ